MPGIRTRTEAPTGTDYDGCHTNRHDDLVIPALTAGAGSAVMTFERLRDTNFWTYFFRHDQDDYLSLGFQMPHRKKLGSNLDSVHLHIMPCVAPASSPLVAYFSATYIWVNIGETIPATVGWSALTYTSISIATANAFTHMDHSVLTNIAPPANEAYSSMLLVLVGRLGTSLNDTYNTNKSEAVPPNTAAANLMFLSADCHIVCDRFGSINVTSD